MPIHHSTNEYSCLKMAISTKQNMYKKKLQMGNRNAIAGRNNSRRAAARGIRKPDSKNRSKNILAKNSNSNSKSDSTENSSDKKNDER